MKLFIQEEKFISSLAMSEAWHKVKATGAKVRATPDQAAVATIHQTSPSPRE